MNAQARDKRVVVIGAGMAGILSGIQLRKAGYNDIAIYEKAGQVGGTWRENTYPGLTCDVPSHSYTYTFEPNPEWSHHLPPGDEIQEYFVNTADKYAVNELISFNEEIVACEYVNGRWHLETASGRKDQADFVIAATGVLHHPRYPDIEGMDDFKGDIFHSARWDHSVALEGKRIGIVGTGSTGVQIVSALADKVGHLSHFMRSPQWIMPTENPEFSEEQKQAFRDDPALLKHMQKDPELEANIERFSAAIVDPAGPEMHLIEEYCRGNLDNSVADPELREKLRPDYRAACKRLVYSPDYYQAIQHPNAEVVREDISRIEAKGIRTADGKLHELDVIVLATGFRADQFMRPMNVVGRNGAELNAIWAEVPRAYMAISVPDFPNLFMLNGPNGPVGNFSLIEIAEQQLHYIMQLMDLVCEGECKEVSASWDALEQFDKDRIAAAKTTIFGTGCKSWYLDSRGVPATWPWTRSRFSEEMKAPRLDAYELV